MSGIKSMKPRTGSSKGPKQGYFDVKHSLKYDNPLNEPCIYRSSYEYKFMLWCERNDYVKQWASEPTFISYTCLVTGKIRKYWIDFTIRTVKDEVWLIEVKPLKEVREAEAFGKRLKILTQPAEKSRLIQNNQKAAKNWSKWLHAKKECEAKGYVFKLVTEQFLQI